MKKFRQGFCLHLRFNYKGISIFILLALALVSCSSELYVPKPEDATPEVTFTELQQGRKLYVNKCSSCHALYLPEKYPSDEWRRYVEDMGSEAGATTEEKELMVKYLTKGKE